MNDSDWVLFGILAFLAQGIGFAILSEITPLDQIQMQHWLVMRQRILLYLAGTPSPETRAERLRYLVSVGLAILFLLVPWGSQMMDSHPCAAWLFFSLALVCGAYFLWFITPMSRWVRLVALAAGTTVFALLAIWSIDAGTPLDFFFVNPGVFLTPASRGEWLLIVTGENTSKSLFNVQMILQDVVTTRSVPDEPDAARREAMIRSGTIEKDYPEIGPTFLGDKILWLPMDVNNQEYNIQARYRIGDNAFLSSEELRIANVGARFVSAQQSVNPTWQFSVTVRNQSGVVLMHCVDPLFPRDARWQAGPTCLPSKYKPLARSLCDRCFGRGFEFYQQ